MLRIVAYGWMFALVASTPRPVWVWLWVVTAFAWGVYDHCKRPDDAKSKLRAGIWIEMLLIATTCAVVHDAMVLFLLVSPVARAGVHLFPKDLLAIGVVSATLVWVLRIAYGNTYWIPSAQTGALLAAIAYTWGIGVYIRQRDQFQQWQSISLFEREQRARDEERLRIAAQLHDVTGQYWTAVIRALDVAISTDGDLQTTLLHKARTAAVEGLSTMRESVHGWHHGQQTAASWIAFLDQAIPRLRELTGTSITCTLTDIDWGQFPQSSIAAEVFSRVVVESITNAIRHGQASHVHVMSLSDEEAMIVDIEDNGRGIHPSLERINGIGVQSMRQLAIMVHGSFMIEALATGTRVRLTIPRQATVEDGIV